MQIVHVVGTGTIGEPLIGLLSLLKKDLGIDEVTFHKNSPLERDRTKVVQLLARGARLAVNEGKAGAFEALGLKPELSAEEAIARATVVIDCTPKGVGLENKRNFYEKYSSKVRGFIAQGSESGFGKPYAYTINDSSLQAEKDQFIQVVSCNTHNIACLLKTLVDVPTNLIEARFVCLRRASDTSQDEDFIPGVNVDPHKDSHFGTHHARDASRLFKTLGTDYQNLFSSSCVVPSQYMHGMHFAIRLWTGVWAPDVTIPSFIHRLKQNPMISVTWKKTTNSVYSFGRDYGLYGRILNQTVVSLPTLTIRDLGKDRELMGFCFTPQDGNSLMSSVAATLWFLNEGKDIGAQIAHLKNYIFEEI